MARGGYYKTKPSAKQEPGDVVPRIDYNLSRVKVQTSTVIAVMSWSEIFGFRLKDDELVRDLDFWVP